MRSGLMDAGRRRRIDFTRGLRTQPASWTRTRDASGNAVSWLRRSVATLSIVKAWSTGSSAALV